MSRNFLICAALALAALPASGQQPPVHYFQSGDLPPGTIGHAQLLRFPHLRGYFQPVQFLLPEGVRLSLNVDGRFDPPRQGPVLAGLHVGLVYPLKVTRIPFHEGAEVFPTLELINRIYPPVGRELHFPIPVEITREEIELALSGRFVTRVIYLEDTHTALAYRDEPGEQRYYEAAPDQDPLQVADRLGRPVAILRMGSRVPELDTMAGASHQPPVILYESPESQEATPISAAIRREARNYPRRPVQPAPATRVYRVGFPNEP